MTSPLTIPWHGIYTAVAWFTAVDRQHTKPVTISVRADRDRGKQAVEKRRELQRFVTVDLASVYGSNGSNKDDDSATVVSDASIS